MLPSVFIGFANYSGMHLSRSTTIVIAAAIVVLGIVAYIMWGKTGETPTVSVTGAPKSAAEATFVDLATQLEPIGFDTTVLSDPRYTALQDIHTSVISEAAGRNDPFAPLGGAR